MIVDLPPPVLPGDRVGVAALSGPVDPERLEAGVETLVRLGFEPVVAPNLHLRTTLFAGTDDERIDGFHRLAADPAVNAIFFARGGHGVLRLLDRLDWDLLRRRPRAYLGYSDLTAFLNQVVSRLGLAAFHGPMVAVEMGRGLVPEEEVSLLAALAGELPLDFPLEPLAGTSAEAVEGRLMGGCLSLLTCTLDTPWALPLAGSLLFWEDVDEPLYRLDRMLTHLRLSGSLAAIRGMVVGRVEPADDEACEEDLTALLHELSHDFGWPVARGLASGHSQPNLTLPLGLTARLDPARGRLEIAAPSGIRSAQDQ